MKESKTFSFKTRLHSFRHAFHGLKILFKHEHNARIQLFIAIMVVAVGLWLCLNTWEWAMIIIAIALVFVTEIINSAIEYLSDHVSIDFHETIKIVKDLSAAAVLVAAMASVAVGLFIFLPKILTKLL